MWESDGSYNVRHERTSGTNTFPAAISQQRTSFNDAMEATLQHGLISSLTSAYTDMPADMSFRYEI